MLIHTYYIFSNNAAYIEIIIFSVQNLSVFIRQSKSNVTFLETQPSYTIGQVKAMIQESRGIATGELKLIVDAQLLEDGYTLSDYGIHCGATIGTYRMDIHIMIGYIPPRVFFYHSLRL